MLEFLRLHAAKLTADFVATIDGRMGIYLAERKWQRSFEESAKNKKMHELQKMSNTRAINDLDETYRREMATKQNERKTFRERETQVFESHRWEVRNERYHTHYEDIILGRLLADNEHDVVPLADWTSADVQKLTFKGRSKVKKKKIFGGCGRGWPS
jgi:hypothetical protein